MAELQAVGPEPDQQWQESLRTGMRVCLGREPRSGYRVPWDARISREHAILQYDGTALRVERMESARNKIYFHEQPASEFDVHPGEEFRIGKTTFRLVDATVGVRTDDPFHRETFNVENLDAVEFGNATERLEALARLPETITGCTDDGDFASRIAKLLLEAIPSAEGVGVLRWGAEMGDTPAVERKEIRATNPTFELKPSRRLMAEALNSGETVAHTWADDGALTDDEINAGEIPSSSRMDWAFCVPITGEACEGWCLYVTGRTGFVIGPPDVLRGDMRFVQLVAQFVGAIGRVLQLEKQRAGMARFFSPVVVESMKNEMRHVSFADRDTDHNTGSRLLVPREGNITVLFCDLRGFSRQTERAEENLAHLMERVSEALGLMSNAILRFDGVVADFIGDAALGFWGWPDPVEDGPVRAARAALTILREFHNRVREGDRALEGFRIGIGIAHGLAIAGRIGTLSQAKVDVFGPVVNVGSRLEGMTKQFRTQVLIDETTAAHVREHLPAAEGRVRRLAVVRPAGMDKPVTVTELLPAEGTIGCMVSNRAIVDYEHALDQFTGGKWPDALDALDNLPVEDRVKHFLMVHIAQHGYEPPGDWDGVINLVQK